MHTQLRSFFVRALTILALWAPASHAFVCEPSKDLTARQSWDQNLFGWTGLVDVSAIRCDLEISKIYYDWVDAKSPADFRVSERLLQVLNQIETLGPKASAIGGSVQEILTFMITKAYDEGRGAEYLDHLARLKVPSDLIVQNVFKATAPSPTVVDAAAKRDFTKLELTADLSWQLSEYYRLNLKGNKEATVRFFEAIKFAGRKDSGISCDGCALRLFELAQEDRATIGTIETALVAELNAQKADLRAEYIHRTYLNTLCQESKCLRRLGDLGFDTGATVSIESKEYSALFNSFGGTPYQLTVLTHLALESKADKAVALFNLGAKASEDPSLYDIALVKGISSILEKIPVPEASSTMSNSYNFVQVRRATVDVAPDPTLNLYRFLPKGERVIGNKELVGLTWRALAASATLGSEKLKQALTIVERDFVKIEDLIQSEFRFSGYSAISATELTKWFPSFIKTLSETGRLKPGTVSLLLNSMFKNEIYQIREYDRDPFLEMLVSLRKYDGKIELDRAVFAKAINPTFRATEATAFRSATLRAIEEYSTLTGYRLANARRRLKGEALRYPPRSYVAKPYTTVFEYDLDGIKTKVDIAKTTREAFAFLQAQKSGYNTRNAWLAGARALAAKHFARSKDKSVTVTDLEKILLDKAGKFSSTKKLKLAFDGVAGKPLAYNKDAINIFDAFSIQKLQCSSGTALFAHEMILSQMAFGADRVPVIIHTRGHAMPGFLKRAGSADWTLEGVETTVDGEQIVDFGFVKDNAVPMAVVELSDHYASEVLINGILDAAAFKAAVLEKMKTRYGFKALESSFALPPGADAELNNNLFAFGSANVPAGDLPRTPKSRVTPSDYVNRTPILQGPSRQQEITGELQFRAAPPAYLDLESLYHAIHMLTRSSDKALDAANLVAADSYDYSKSRTYHAFDYNQGYGEFFVAFDRNGIAAMDQFISPYSYGWSKDSARCVLMGSGYFSGAPTALVKSPSDKRAAYAGVIDEGGRVHVLCDFGSGVDKEQSLKLMNQVFEGLIRGQLKDSTPYG